MTAQTSAEPAALSAEDIAAVLDLAREHIEEVGYCKRYLYSIRQADEGTPLDRCAVDVIGAITVAVHGTPRHGGSDPLTYAAEQALLARIDIASLASWCDLPGNGEAQAILLLRETAAHLRGEQL
ncbi:hypothetical protein [Streptomyces sp. NPDC059786]|uniref:DUF6197 family protein n=1 Tax=Streptomyces sp. NPDC059786 TaxID=3346946 RepID=UPI003667BE15